MMGTASYCVDFSGILHSDSCIATDEKNSNEN